MTKYTYDGDFVDLRSKGPSKLIGKVEYENILISSQTPQTLTGAGAVDIITATTLLITTSADALTLADGAEGQRKLIIMKTDGGDGTLTPAHLSNGSTITFDDAGDSADLVFIDGSWNMVGGTATLA